MILMNSCVFAKITPDTLNQLSTQVCNPESISPFIFDQPSVEISEFKKVMFGDGNTTLRAVSFTHDRNTDTPLKWGNTQLTEQGQFVVPFVRGGLPDVSEGLPNERLFRCSYNSEEAAFNLVFSNTPTQLDTAIEHAQYCIIGSANFLYHEGDSYLGYHNVITSINTQQLTTQELVSSLFSTIRVTPPTLLRNEPILFKQNSEIIGNNTNCNINDIKPDLLFCLDLSGEKAYYMDSLASLTQTLQEKCYCEGCTESGCPEGMGCATHPATTVMPTIISTLIPSTNETGTPNNNGVILDSTITSAVLIIGFVVVSGAVFLCAFKQKTRTPSSEFIPLQNI